MKLFTTLLTATFFVTSALGFSVTTTPDKSAPECGVLKIKWDDTGAKSYNVLLLNPKDLCGDALADLGDHSSTQISWKVTLKKGTQFVVSVEDNKGDEALSPTITVEKGDSSCVNNNAAIGGVASSSVAPAPLPTSSGPAVPIGAANAGNGPFHSGALTMRQVSTPAIAMSALLVAFVLSL